MNKIEFTDKNGTFRIHNPENYSGLYLPLAGETGLKSSITPNLGGDSKTDQNHFLLEPVSIENLHNNRNTRNFWCRIENKGSWSVCGSSAKQEAAKFTKDQDESINHFLCYDRWDNGSNDDRTDQYSGSGTEDYTGCCDSALWTECRQYQGSSSCDVAAAQN